MWLVVYWHLLEELGVIGIAEHMTNNVLCVFHVLVQLFLAWLIKRINTSILEAGRYYHIIMLLLTEKNKRRTFNFLISPSHAVIWPLNSTFNSFNGVCKNLKVDINIGCDNYRRRNLSCKVSTSDHDPSVCWTIKNVSIIHGSLYLCTIKIFHE